jgi:hypothetical protein
MTDPSIYPGRVWTSAEWNSQIEFHRLYVRSFDSWQLWAAEMDRRHTVTMVLYDCMTQGLDCTYQGTGMTEETNFERRQLIVELSIQHIRFKTRIQNYHIEWLTEQALNS